MNIFSDVHVFVAGNSDDKILVAAVCVKDDVKITTDFICSPHRLHDAKSSTKI